MITLLGGTCVSVALEAVALAVIAAVAHVQRLAPGVRGRSCDAWGKALLAAIAVRAGQNAAPATRLRAPAYRREVRRKLQGINRGGARGGE